MKFRETLRSLEPRELLPVAAELLQLLEGGVGETAAPRLTAGENRPRAAQWASLPAAAAQGAEPAPALSTETVPNGALPWTGQPAAGRSGDAAGAAPALRPGGEIFDSGPAPEEAAQLSAPETARFSAAGDDLEALSEYFRRDSRRYDNGFGGDDA